MLRLLLTCIAALLVAHAHAQDRYRREWEKWGRLVRERSIAVS